MAFSNVLKPNCYLTQLGNRFYIYRKQISHTENH